jgi:MoaA/NifB/PqqE/SkfB family radical SAM enzyme
MPDADLNVVLMSREPQLLREAYCVAESARAKGFGSTVVELDPGLSDAAILDRLREAGGRTTALGVTAETLDRCVGAAESVVRELGPVLMFGRLFATDLERRKVPTGAATGVVVGPAGPTVVDFLRSENGGTVKPIAGLDRLDGDLRPRPPRGAWFEGAFPRFGGADLVWLRRVGLPIRLSYGCPRRCAFCGEQPREGGFRARTAGDVVDEMMHHAQHNNVRRFQFCDLALNGDLRLLDAVCDLLLERGGDLVWWGRALVDGAMPRSLYRKMRLAGCVGLELMILSGSDLILERACAGFTADEAGEALGRASAAGINTRVSLMVGFPGETERQFGETCAFLYKNRFNISQIKDIESCSLEPGSLLLRQPASFGVCVLEDNDWHHGGYNTSAYRLKRSRELRVFVEDQLHLEVVGRAPAVPWDPDLRDGVGGRLLELGRRATVRTGRFRGESLGLAGVVRRGRALAGPSYLEIDLTNNCNQHCAGCWLHSYLMGDDRLSGAERRATLEYDRVAQLIRSAKSLGARRLQLSGAGEPFMHPRIEDVLELAKDQELDVNVITNFTLVDEDRARLLVDLGVDSVTVSLWAGTAPTYVRTHPTASETLFERIVRVVSHLTWYRRQTGARFPRVKIYNVISNLNCHEIHAMIDVAREVGADLIEFTPIDIVPGKTDSLALSEEDGERILDQLLSLRRRPDYLQRTAEEATGGRVPGLEEQGEFARFLQRHRLPGDFRFCLDDIRRWETYCRRGVHCSRVYEEIERDSAIFFGYPGRECHGCMAVVDCSIDPLTLTVRAPYLSLQGFGSFWRRVRGGSSSERDARVVDKVPCSVGYTYARVQATGHVIPCCKAADMPLGNILEQSFEEIWFSDAYDEFRRNAIALPKSDPYFAPMECYKVCDNLGHNMAVDGAIRSLSDEERRELAQEDNALPARRPAAPEPDGQ